MSEVLVINCEDDMLKAFEDVLHCRMCKGFYNYCVMAVCGHNFCAHCIRKRMRTSHDCPFCFENLTEADLRNNKLIDKVVRLYEKLRSKSRQHAQGKQAEKSQELVCPKIEIMDDTEKSVDENDDDVRMEEVNRPIIHLLNPVNITDSITANNTTSICESSTHSNRETTCAVSNTFETTVLTYLERIKDQIKEANKTFDQIESHIALTSKFQVKESKVTQLPLPIRDEKDLESVENFLKTSKNDSEMVTHLVRLGGFTVKEHIILCMKRLFGSEYSREWNLFGKKGKQPFSSLNIYKVVIRANQSKFPLSTEKEVNKYISLYLSGARDRFGGRKEREKL